MTEMIYFCSVKLGHYLKSGSPPKALNQNDSADTKRLHSSCTSKAGDIYIGIRNVKANMKNYSRPIHGCFVFQVLLVAVNACSARTVA